MIRGVDGASRRSSGARPLALVCAGIAILVGAGVVACNAQPPKDVGAATVTALASSPIVEPSIQNGSLPSADPVTPPVRLSIPAMKLTATVAAVGVDPRTGDFAVPPSVDRVGWYRFGPGLEATSGSIVIAGHVDSAAQGKGAFFRLGSLQVGDRLTLTAADGTTREFRTVARERYAKSRIPLEKYFALDGAPRLTLITCGGPFDAKTRHYRDNVVVTASPV